MVKSRKQYKKQEDRLLKRLTGTERLIQSRIRKAIEADIEGRVFADLFIRR